MIKNLYLATLKDRSWWAGMFAVGAWDLSWNDGVFGTFIVCVGLMDFIRD